MVDYSFGNRLIIIFCVLLLINILLYYNESSSSSDDELVTLQSTLLDSRLAQKAPKERFIPALRFSQDSFDYKIYTNVVITSTSADFFNYASLQYWESTGQNHLVVFVDTVAPLQTNETWKTIFVSSKFHRNQYSANMDFQVYTNAPDYNKNVWSNYSHIVGHKKEILLSFASSSRDLLREEVDLFSKCETESPDCLFDLACSDDPKMEERSELCSDKFYRAKVGLSSTFTLVLPSADSNQQRIFEALMYNSIPVVVGDQSLPFQDFIDWNTAVVRLPKGRLHQVMSILKQIPQQRVFEMRKAGRFFMDYYIGDAKVLTRSILSAVRFRLGLFAPPEKSAKVSVLLTSPAKEGSNVSQLVTDSLVTALKEDTYFLWNKNPSYLDASSTVPFSPTPALTNVELSPSFINLERHPNFGETLSGNHPHEFFTIVMLCYKRDDQVQYTLKQMDGLPFLHSIIVVWNDVSRQPPSEWPHIHVPIHVLNATRNSLNNRFLPLDLIRTEAVFNMDDDFNVKPEDILFSFRVWRENRDVIVGPNFRLGYLKDNKGVYDASPQCQYNMVLTSGAFIHKSYLRTYTNDMPEVIRERIDKLHNCEDIAVNFLISHLTRKPPIKTTPIINTKGKFSLQGLSTRHSHYTERAECILSSLKCSATTLWSFQNTEPILCSTT
uniref:Uncharacterized protein n=1 Tax=Ditylenchus dipsaci TaxID=166011 RepID=A0A915EBC3_9BILA